ncbi:hypothetical protein P3T27_006488 [Kitasatospora sp. MAA19]|uniref:hypothetical protein n=1 Tax=Kitasatospora sp. MAA19 TaxID=3035090 RepID=UPI002476C030|nr:hypothetical protein [Kitasatospora sp. MAA19]MDH6709739.1 hypothetical protein [Kitasatospora sp. MAA19]
MTVRLDQLPRDLSWLARRLHEVVDDIAQIRAHTPDTAAADALLAPADTDITRWPQTAGTTYTTISRCYNIAWKPRLRILVATTTSGGSTGTIRVSINGTPWATGNAGAALDTTAALPPTVAIGDQYQITVEAVRTSGAGSVYAQVQLIRAVD